ncbi:(2Fe-2S)-binding protein [Nocardia sp. NPDC051750]|uniref:(2Fe-2S)-binding protein n=1 Tax=Nocardia sp. NPDC051750 TaxID=3364325 RepID=UPI0037A02E57
MAVVAQSADVVTSARGPMLTDEAWLAARIAELNASWRTDSLRVGATLWWCMTASALVEQVVRAVVRGTPIPPPTLDRLDLSLRPDGSVEKVRILDADADADAGDYPGAGKVRADDPRSGTRETAASNRARDAVPPESRDIPEALRATLATVIGRITAVSGVREPALWAVVTDVIASWAVDAGVPQAGQRLAAEIGDRVPAPRFVEVSGRTFVRRASCCLVYEAPGCEKCVSCPKRAPAERAALLAGYARRA